MKKIIMALLFLALAAGTGCAESAKEANANWDYIESAGDSGGRVPFIAPEELPVGFIKLETIGVIIYWDELMYLTPDELKNLSVFLNLLTLKEVNALGVEWDRDLQKTWFKKLLPRIYKSKFQECK